MLDRYWRELLATGGVVVAIGIALAVNYYFEGVHQREAAADSRGRYADHQAVCEQLVPPGPMRPDCLIQQAKAEHAEKHSEADLRAQLDNASWTFSLMLLGVGGLVLSGLGVVLVYLNLRAFQEDIQHARADSEAADARFQKQLDKMEEANRDARGIGQAQVRAYLTATTAGCALAMVEESIDILVPYLRVDGVVSNTGQSPALNIRVECRVHLDTEAELYQNTVEVRIPDISARIEERYRAMIRFPELAREPATYDHVESVHVWVTVKGTDVFGEPLDVGATYFRRWPADMDRLQMGPMQRGTGPRPQT